MPNGVDGQTICLERSLLGLLVCGYVAEPEGAASLLVSGDFFAHSIFGGFVWVGYERLFNSNAMR